MSILIKGMEMPKEGTVITIYKLNGQFYASVHGPGTHYTSITNADRIRAMTDEELAEQVCDHTCMLCPIEGCEGRIEEGRKKCKQYWLDWLKREVDND